MVHGGGIKREPQTEVRHDNKPRLQSYSRPMRCGMDVRQRSVAAITTNHEGEREVLSERLK